MTGRRAHSDPTRVLILCYIKCMLDAEINSVYVCHALHVCVWSKILSMHKVRMGDHGGTAVFMHERASEEMQDTSGHKVYSA